MIVKPSDASIILEHSNEKLNINFNTTIGNIIGQLEYKLKNSFTFEEVDRYIILGDCRKRLGLFFIELLENKRINCVVINMDQCDACELNRLCNIKCSLKIGDNILSLKDLKMIFSMTSNNEIVQGYNITATENKLDVIRKW